MRRGHVEWGDGPRTAEVFSPAGLDVLLDRIDAEARTSHEQVLAVVYVAPEVFFSVGLGVDETFVGFDDQTVWEGYLSRGDLYEDEQEIEFWFGNQPSFCPRWALVPVKTARAVMRDGFATGRRPDSIRWEVS